MVSTTTALSACQTLAYKKPGYFTASRARTSSSITGSEDFVLPAGFYYYHLTNQGSNPLYPIQYVATFTIGPSHTMQCRRSGHLIMTRLLQVSVVVIGR
jgi:hypothetical protein